MVHSGRGYFEVLIVLEVLSEPMNICNAYRMTVEMYTYPSAQCLPLRAVSLRKWQPVILQSTAASL